jgi:hypothetical protein
MKGFSRGNALMEYALPIVLLLLAAGVLATIVDVKSLLGEYFLSASGYTKSALAGGTFTTNALPTSILDQSGSGADITMTLGSLTDGQGQAVAATSGSGSPMTGIFTRSGDRPQPSTTETLF